MAEHNDPKNSLIRFERAGITYLVDLTRAMSFTETDRPTEWRRLSSIVIEANRVTKDRWAGIL